MPLYEYFCPAGDRTVQVVHGMKDRAENWGELCELAGIEPGDIPPDSPVERLLFPVQVSTPTGDSALKNMGFTKLVRRDKGVYENVTRTGSESRYMEAGKNDTMPDFQRKIRD